MSNQKVFLQCDVCGKNIIERLPNGLFRFMFGKKGEEDFPPVEILIHGNIKMRCLRRSCKEWNVFNFLPFAEIQSETKFSVDNSKRREVK